MFVSRKQKREYEFSTRIEGVQCIARIDLALQLSDKEWAIVDYKSGKKSDWSLELYKNQVSYYAALFAYANEVDVPKCAIVYAGVPMGPPLWFKPSIAIAEIKDAISRIEAGDFKPTDDKRCVSCPYSGVGSRWVCKFGWDKVKGNVKTRKRNSKKVAGTKAYEDRQSSRGRLGGGRKWRPKLWRKSTRY